MGLTTTTVPQTARASEFVDTCRRAGFSPSETRFLAEQHAMFDRGSLRGIRLGSVTLMDFSEGASVRISEALAQVKTPVDLVAYREGWINSWAGKNQGCGKETIIELFSLIYKKTLSDQMKAWTNTDQPLNDTQTWEQAQAFVNESMIRRGIEGEHGIVPMPLKQAIQEVGLHTLTWNKWLYPTAKDEAVLGGELVAFNKGLQAQTGLSGPLLGLGGGVRLYMGDDTLIDDGGVFSNSIKIYSKTSGKNSFGGAHIRVPGYTGFSCLAHEWFHAFDYLMGDLHQHTMSSQIPGTAGARAVAALGEPILPAEGEVDRTIPLMLELMRGAKDRLSTKPDELLEQFDRQVSMGEPAGGWGQWAIAMGTSGDHQRYALRSLGVIGSHATGTLRSGVSHAWLDLYPDDYLEKPEEQMAFAFERSCLQTGHLPSSAPNPTWVVRSCVRSELVRTHQIFSEFFAAPEIHEKWDAMIKSQESSPLLDAIASRRLAKRRAGSSRAKVPG